MSFRETIMDRTRSYLILLLTIAAGIALSVFIYVKYHLMFFVFFIPLIGIGGSFFSRMMRRPSRYDQENRPKGGGTEYRPRYTVHPDDRRRDD
jgi:hypothetical protein